MKYIIIMGHGNYATGTLSALNMLSGQEDEVLAIDFLEGETELDLTNKINKVYNNVDQFLFVCDLMGGTPFKEAAKLALNNNNVKVVTGVNIGALIEAKLKRNNLELNVLAEEIIKATNKHAMNPELKIVKQEEAIDGI